MTSILPTNQNRPISQLKEQIFGNPERSLQQAYQAASKIKSIEDKYFDGNRIPLTVAEDSADFPPSQRAEFDKNLSLLKRKTKEFDRSSSVLGKLGANHLEKLIFVEGILAKYIAEPSSSALMPLPATTAPPQSNGHSSSTTEIVEVKSSAPETRPSRANGRQNQERKTVNSQVKDDDPLLEKKGFLPRSIGRTVDKIKNDFNPKAEQEVVNNFRRSRQMTIVALRLFSLLIVVPLLTQQLSKHFLILPIVEQVRGEEAPVFLNAEMKEEALQELHSFEEDVEWENIVKKAPPIAPEAMEEKVQRKATELLKEYHHKSNNAISNVFADLLAAGSFALVLVVRRKDINVLKSFIDNIVYGLSDSAKAFIIILSTDMFVGYHSAHGWEVLLETFASHLGIAASHGAIFLFIATVPVVMDTLFKYWIFRYLSRMSPSTVATFKDMNE